MKLIVRRGGGFAGMVRRTELDDSDLSPELAQAFADQVDRAAVRSLNSPAPGRRYPDAQLYDVLLEEDGRQVELAFSDQTLPEAVRQLIAWVDARPERGDSVEM